MRDSDAEVLRVVFEPFVTPMPCGCVSHDLAAHQGTCGHCGADTDESCAPDCPVDGIDREWARTSREVGPC